MNFREQMNKAIDAWESGNVQDEWMFQKLRQDVVGKMSPVEAFEAIPSVLAELQEHTEECVGTELIETVLALAARSETTEIPDELNGALCNLHDQFAQYGEYAKDRLKEVLRFYRL